MNTLLDVANVTHQANRLTLEANTNVYQLHPKRKTTEEPVLPAPSCAMQ